MKKSVLFICTGNVCRSPMAEGLFQHRMGKRLEVRVASAGIGAMEGFPASENAVEVMAELGIDISNFYSQSLRSELVQQADFIFTMTRQQQDVIDRTFHMSV